jgi:hypothetical protein
VLHVRICAGGGEQSPSLPRPLVRPALDVDLRDFPNVPHTDRQYTDAQLAVEYFSLSELSLRRLQFSMQGVG